jgi:cobalt-zinc-cadmium efflux system membrane fusion protein
VVLSGPSAAYVRVEPAAPVTGERSHRLVAQVGFDERHLARLGPPVQGRVASIRVVTGDHVKAGDVLLTIHAPDIATAQAQVEQARTARVLAEKAAARAQMLASQGAGTEAERQQAEAALQQAKNEEQRAIAALAALGGASGSADYALRSPIDGTVVERNVAVGNEVHTDQDQPLLVVADLSTVWVVADVFEQDLARVRVGDPATIEVKAYAGRTFEGTVTFVADTLDPQTRSARARIELPNADRALKPGMFAYVTVKGTKLGAAEVPNGALLARRDEFFVFVKNDDGSYAPRKVEVGEQHGAHTTILQGLRPGEPVVTEGAILLDAELNEAL